VSESISDERLATLAAALDLDVMSTGVCHACLSFVSFPLARGDPADARREARGLAPHLWDEGLEAPVRRSLARARDAGLPGAAAALQDVESRGGRSRVVCAIVLRLAADLANQIETEGELIAVTRLRLPPAPPGLN
jgi:hypothetical protein